MQPVGNETDGYGYHSLQLSLPGSQVPSGSQMIKFFATGIDSLRKYRDYVSQMAVDAIRVTADVYPVLENGQRTVHVPQRQLNTNISWYNARTTRGWWLDTTTYSMGAVTSARPGAVIRVGLAPVEWNWPTVPPDGKKWRATCWFGSDYVDIDSIDAFVLVSRTAPIQPMQFTITSSETELLSRLTQLPSGSEVAIFSAGRVASPTLITSLSNRKLPAPTGTHWVVCGYTDGDGATAFSSGSAAFGTTFMFDQNQSQQLTFDVHLPAGPPCVLHVADEKAVLWARVRPAHLANLAADTAQADLIIITHATHRDQAERLAAHRRKTNGLSVKVVDVDAILDEFGNGHRTVEALRTYLAWHYDRASQPPIQAAILFGNASWDPRLAVKGGNVQSRLPDQVPTYGRPSSDYYIGLLDDPSDRVQPEIIVGRLPAVTELDGKALVDKIIHADTAQYEPWMRRWMFVGGGTAEEGLCDIYQRMLEDPFGTDINFLDPPLCLDTVTVCKNTAPPNAGYLITREIDAGLQWLNYIGHGATDIFDITGWEPSELSNTNKYGLLATLSCQTGAFSNPSVPCKNAQYLTIPQRGFAAAVGGTGYQYIFMVDFLHYRLHDVMREGSRLIGPLMYKAKAPVAQSGSQPAINAVMQFCLLGDPFTRIAMDTTNNISIRGRDVRITPQPGSLQITDRDSVAVVTVNIVNQGVGSSKPLPIRLVTSYEDITDSTTVVFSNGICQSAVATFRIPVFGRSGEHRIVLTADPNNTYGDDTTDNVVRLSFSVLPQSLLPLEPVPYEQFSGTTLHVRQIDPLGTSESRTVSFVLSRERSRDPNHVVVSSHQDQVVRDQSIIDWETQLPDVESGRYWIGSWTTNEEGEESAVLWIPCEYSSNSARIRLNATDLQSLSGNSIVYDEDSKSQMLADLSKSIHLRSNGIAPNDTERNPPLDITIGSITYVRNPFFRGINLAVLTQFDTVPRVIRRYDTWRDPLPIESGHNGFTSDLIRFLRDSVAPGERVLFAACNEAFSGFFNDNNRDSLVEILKYYGSSYADSLRPNSSWVMIGSPGMPAGSASETWKGAPDSLAILETTLVFYVAEGYVTSSVIGPAAQWESATLDHDSAGVTCSVFGRNSLGEEYLITETEQGTDRVTLTNVPPGTSHLRFQWKLVHIPNAGKNSGIRGVRVWYTPAHEVVIEDADFSVLPDTLLRGDTASAFVRIRNADRRWPVNGVVLRVVHDSVEQHSYQTIVNLEANDATTIAFPLPTSTAPTRTITRVFANPDASVPEFYRFNNQQQSALHVVDDSVPPILRSYADVRLLQNGDYVGPEPFFEVRVHDNSNLPITDPSRLVVFVNGLRIREGAVRDYAFLPTDSCLAIGSDNSLRAILRFRTPMDVGQNNLLVRAQDATGNSAELDLAIYLATQNSITRAVVVPNPTSGPTRFDVYLRSPTELTPARIHISDLQGREIATISADIPVGSGSITWNGYTSQGTSVAPGPYVWHLVLQRTDGYWTTAQSGIFQVLR